MYLSKAIQKIQSNGHWGIITDRHNPILITDKDGRCNHYSICPAYAEDSVLLI